MRELMAEGFRFALVGLASTATHLGAALVALWAGAPALVANSIGFLCGLGISVVGHHHFSFGRSVPFLRGALRFIPASLAGFLANTLVLSVLVANGTLPMWLSLVISVGAIPPITFAYSHLYAYRVRTKPRDDQ